MFCPSITRRRRHPENWTSNSSLIWFNSSFLLLLFGLIGLIGGNGLSLYTTVGLEFQIPNSEKFLFVGELNFIYLFFSVWEGTRRNWKDVVGPTCGLLGVDRSRPSYSDLAFNPRHCLDASEFQPSKFLFVFRLFILRKQIHFCTKIKTKFGVTSNFPFYFEFHRIQLRITINISIIIIFYRLWNG